MNRVSNETKTKGNIRQTEAHERQNKEPPESRSSLWYDQDRKVLPTADSRSGTLLPPLFAVSVLLPSTLPHPQKRCVTQYETKQSRLGIRACTKLLS